MHSRPWCWTPRELPRPHRGLSTWTGLSSPRHCIFLKSLTFLKETFRNHSKVRYWKDPKSSKAVQGARDLNGTEVLPVSLATSDTSSFLISAMYPSTVKMTNPETRLITQFTTLVTRASLERKTQGAEAFPSQEAKEHLSPAVQGVSRRASQGLQAWPAPSPLPARPLRLLGSHGSHAAVTITHGRDDSWPGGFRTGSCEQAQRRPLGVRQNFSEAGPGLEWEPEGAVASHL